MTNLARHWLERAGFGAAQSYVRGLAFNAKGKRAEAGQEDSQLVSTTAAIPPDRPLGTSNRAKNVAEVAQGALAINT
jgi:hypothetical protein